MSARVSIIINPVAGTGAQPGRTAALLDLARSLAREHRLDAGVRVTERPGHARELAGAALAAGIDTVVAWGGDGTLNEVASALAFRRAVVGIVPSGSGNGLARALGVPLSVREAFAVAIDGREAAIDAGELEGHLFFNVAGVGLDARVAHEFAAHGLARRGFRRYLEITARELWRYQPEAHTIRVDAVTIRSRALMIALANGSQYGNGARIAPQARCDDGQLDVVVIDARPAWRALLQIPRVFLGQIGQVAGVTVLRGSDIEIACGRPLIFHVDGEPFVGGARVTARVHQAALRVRLPART